MTESIRSATFEELWAAWPRDGRADFLKAAGGAVSGTTSRVSRATRAAGAASGYSGAHHYSSYGGPRARPGGPHAEDSM